MANFEQIFFDSYQRVLGNNFYNAEFISTFYECFFSKSPSIADMFANTNMSMQKTMLHDSIQEMLEFYKTKQITPRLEQLAKIHGSKGLAVPQEFYDLWVDSLVEAVSGFDPEFDRQVALAWRLVLAPGVTYINHGG